MLLNILVFPRWIILYYIVVANIFNHAFFRRDMKCLSDVSDWHIEDKTSSLSF